MSGAGSSPPLEGNVMTGARYASFVSQTLFTESVSHLTESFHPPTGIPFVFPGLGGAQARLLSRLDGARSARL